MLLLFFDDERLFDSFRSFLNRFFQTDWNDGRALCSIVRNLGGPAPTYDKLDTKPSSWEHNLQMGANPIKIMISRRQGLFLIEQRNQKKTLNAFQ